MHCPHMMLENSKAWARQATSLQNPYPESNSFRLVFTVLSGSCICLVFLECLSDCTHKQRPLSWLKQDFLFVFVSSLIITKVTVTTKWGLCGGQLINTSATVAWFWGMSLHGFFIKFQKNYKGGDYACWNYRFIPPHPPVCTASSLPTDPSPQNVCMCMCDCRCVPRHTYEGLKTTSGIGHQLPLYLRQSFFVFLLLHVPD